LGYGGGFYDRLLPCLPESAKKISVCFQEQMVDKIPSGKYDIAVDMVLTEKKTYKNGKNLPGK
jgi:5-formyltetrahydrofolate cyclo-ligase